MNTGQTEPKASHAAEAWPNGCDPRTFEGLKRLAGQGQIQPIIEDVAVDLIASGYEWICDRCETLNDEIEALEAVRCRLCGTRFTTNSPEHAYK